MVAHGITVNYSTVHGSTVNKWVLGGQHGQSISVLYGFLMLVSEMQIFLQLAEHGFKNKKYWHILLNILAVFNGSLSMNKRKRQDRILALTFPNIRWRNVCNILNCFYRCWLTFPSFSVHYMHFIKCTSKHPLGLTSNKTKYYRTKSLEQKQKMIEVTEKEALYCIWIGGSLTVYISGNCIMVKIMSSWTIFNILNSKLADVSAINSEHNSTTGSCVK